VGVDGRSDVGMFAVAVAIGDIDIEEAGGIDNAGDAIGVAVAIVSVGADGVDIGSIGAFAGGEGTGSDDNTGGIVTCNAVSIGAECAGSVDKAGGIAIAATVVAIKDIGGTVDVAFTAGGGTGVKGAKHAVAVAGTAFDDGVGIVKGTGSISDIGIVARDALAIAPFDVDVSSIKLASAVSHVKAAVAV